MGSQIIPGQVKISEIAQHREDIGAGGVEAEAMIHGLGNLIPAPTGGTPRDHKFHHGGGGGPNFDKNGSPSVPPYGSGGGALTSPGARVTMQMLESMEDPSGGAVLGQCMMQLLKDAIENRQGAKKEMLQAGLAKVGNALASAANEALQSTHQRSDLEAKANVEMTSFVVGMVSAGVQACAAVAGGVAGGSGTAVGGAISGIGGAVGTFNSAFGHLQDGKKDEIDLNSQTWGDKARQAHLDVMKAVNDGDTQSAQSGLEDASDAVKDCRQMVTQLIQAAKDTFEKGQFTK